ncbi:transposase (plasmid) [Azospirillum brasilense]|uniref:Transposase n=1 Tax=Azospirillum brasilense TaxID=192 RepID=A0A4D8RET0_AZOBR|nr:transposase [Azospirillum brasilense]
MCRSSSGVVGGDCFVIGPLPVCSLTGCSEPCVAGSRTFVRGRGFALASVASRLCRAFWECAIQRQRTNFPENGLVAPALLDLAPVPLPLAWGGWYGTNNGGLVAGIIDQMERAVTGPGRPPVPTNAVLETLRFFLREGVQWRELRASPDRAPGSTVRRRLTEWGQRPSCAASTPC